MKIYKYLMILFLLASNCALALQGLPRPLVSIKPSISDQEIRPGGNFTLTVKAVVAEGFHIGANDKKSLYPASLKVIAPEGITFGAPVYPNAIRKSFAFSPNEKTPVYEGAFVITVKGHVSPEYKPGKVKIKTILDSQGCSDDACLPPEKSSATISFTVSGKPIENVSASQPKGSAGASKDSVFNKLSGKNAFVGFIILYFMGLMLAFTPCIYPMIPVTFGYFSSQKSESRNVAILAAAYVFGIAITYSALGTLAATTGGVFGAYMQKPIVLIGLALLLVILALSMFGLFELQPPAFIQNRASARSGILGAFIMGLIFGFVAAPCAGPVVISLMAYIAKIGSPALGFLFFFGLSLGLGTPLFLLATFSARLPTPGMWMVAVKKIAGFMLLGAAAYFVGPAVPEPLRHYLLPAVLIVGGLYIGFIEKSVADSKFGSKFLRVLGIASIALAVSLLIIHDAQKPHLTWKPYSEEAFAAAVKKGKPVMMDFTADWCAYCKELEAGPFRDCDVIKAASRFERLRVNGNNVDAIRPILTQYEVSGFPTIILFNSSGEEESRIVGMISASELVERLKAVK